PAPIGHHVGLRQMRFAGEARQVMFGVERIYVIAHPGEVLGDLDRKAAMPAIARREENLVMRRRARPRIEIELLPLPPNYDGIFAGSDLRHWGLREGFRPTGSCEE